MQSLLDNEVVPYRAERSLGAVIAHYIRRRVVPGAVSGGIRLVLRLEGLFIFAFSVLVYARLGAGWGVFALFFLAPDLSFLGYLAGPRVGALSYNSAHSLVGVLVVLSAGIVFSASVLITAGTIWAAHIGLDRALGYGLKYAQGFSFTHLGLMGRAPGDS